MGSSFPLKKTTKALPKIQIDDDTELIDEDSLLTEEDLKKPQLPVVGDCEVGATRKACKNCTCGRAQYRRAPADGSPADCHTRCLDPGVWMEPWRYLNQSPVCIDPCTVCLEGSYSVAAQLQK